MHTSRLTTALQQLEIEGEELERALTLWREYVELIEEELLHEVSWFAAALCVFVTRRSAQDVATQSKLDAAILQDVIDDMSDVLDLSPFDPRYSGSSPPTNPMMQQLAGMLFDVCERSHDPLDKTLELPQIATTWTLLVMPLDEVGRPEEVLISLVDNHTKFVLDQRLIDQSAWHIKRIVDMLVSVMQKSGIRPDDIMIQSCEIVHEIRERLNHIHIATSVTRGEHLQELIASFHERFSAPAPLHRFFSEDATQLPENMEALHQHATTFWEKETWRAWPPEMMLDCHIDERSWLVSMLDGSGGRIGLTMFEASEQDTKAVGSQRILLFVPYEQIDHATLAALDIKAFEPIAQDYFALFVDDALHASRTQDYRIASSILEGLNAYAQLTSHTQESHTVTTSLGELTITQAS